MYLGAKAYTIVLLRSLCICNLSLLKGLFYFKATAFYKISVGFLFKLSRDFKGEKVSINKQVNKQFCF